MKKRSEWLEEDVLRHFLLPPSIAEHGDRHPEHSLLVPVEQPLQCLVIPTLPEQVLDILGHPTISYPRQARPVATESKNSRLQPVVRLACINRHHGFWLRVFVRRRDHRADRLCGLSTIPLA